MDLESVLASVLGRAIYDGGRVLIRHGVDSSRGLDATQPRGLIRPSNHGYRQWYTENTDGTEEDATKDAERVNEAFSAVKADDSIRKDAFAHLTPRQAFVAAAQWSASGARVVADPSLVRTFEEIQQKLRASGPLNRPPSLILPTVVACGSGLAAAYLTWNAIDWAERNPQQARKLSKIAAATAVGAAAAWFVYYLYKRHGDRN